MKKQIQTVIVVTAYGKDNYFHKKCEDVVGIYTSVKKAIKGAKKNGLTNSQIECLIGMGALYVLERAINNNKDGCIFQVEYEEETDARKKPCTSSYMFQTFNLD